jgi:riboflavin transporter FmnP
MEKGDKKCPKCSSINIPNDGNKNKLVYENCCEKNGFSYSSSKKVAVCGIFGGLSLVLYLLEVLRIPMGFIFTMTPFLKLNFSDVPIMIASFSYGPIVGGLIVFVKILVKCLITKTGFIGEIADLIISLTYILPAAIIYVFKRKKSGAIIGLIIGTIISTIVACFLNYFILLPMYHWNMNYVDTIKLGVLPFNLFKNILISVIVLMIYKKISNIIEKCGAK